MRPGGKRRGMRSIGRLGLGALLVAGVLTVPSAAAQATATRTVAFWSMDEPAGASVLTDNSGNGRNGTVGAEVVTGALYAGATGHRFATHLPTDQEYVPGHVDLVPHSTDLNPDAGDFSITIRYRTTYSFGNIMQKGQGGTVGGYWKLEAPNGKPKCLFRGGNGSSRTGYTDVSISDGQWHTVTCNRTSTYVEMYVDGVRTSRLTGSTGTIANTKQLSIGGKSQCDGVNVTCDYFAGDIDYVKILKGAGGTANQAPVAKLAPTCSGLVCTFSGAGSTDADGAIQDYRWTFGDGSGADTVSVPTTSHTYGAAGTYPVTLTVTDDRGATASATVQVTVAPVAEKISFVAQATANANSTSHAVTVPSTVQSGDVLLLLLSQNTHATTGEPTGVTGWSRLDRLDGGYATTTAWWKVAAAGDAGSTVRVTLGAQSKGNLVVAAYRGVAATAPVFARATDPASSATRITPHASVAASQSWGVSYWMHGDGLSTGLTAPAGVQVRSNSSQTGGGRVTVLLADSGATVPTGSHGGLSAVGAAASTTTTTWTFVLRPA